MRKIILFILLVNVSFLLSSCGYSGDLYLPKEGDKAQFGVIQMGIGMKPPALNQKELDYGQ